MSFYQCLHVSATATIISSVCATCGFIAKSGRISCCGRGGSWFGNCGGAGNAKLAHTWYEGIRACKTLAQSKTAIGQQLNAAQQQKYFNEPGMAKSMVIRTSANVSINKLSATLETIISTPTQISTANTSTNVSMTAPAQNRVLTTSTVVICVVVGVFSMIL